MMTYVEKLAREPELFVIDIATEPTFIMEQCLDWYFFYYCFLSESLPVWVHIYENSLHETKSHPILGKPLRFRGGMRNNSKD